jgi:hypothetical protein
MPKLKVTMKSPRGDVNWEGTLKGNDIDGYISRETPADNYYHLQGENPGQK